MSNLLCFLMGAVCGAGAMYFSDPQGGRRRRALARDKAASWARDAVECADQEVRQLRNRAYGSAIEARNAKYRSSRESSPTTSMTSVSRADVPGPSRRPEARR